MCFSNTKKKMYPKVYLYTHLSNKHILVVRVRTLLWELPGNMVIWMIIQNERLSQTEYRLDVQVANGVDSKT